MLGAVHGRYAGIYLKESRDRTLCSRNGLKRKQLCRTDLKKLRLSSKFILLVSEPCGQGCTIGRQLLSLLGYALVLLREKLQLVCLGFEAGLQVRSCALGFSKITLEVGKKRLCECGCW